MDRAAGGAPKRAAGSHKNPLGAGYVTRPFLCGMWHTSGSDD